MTPYPKPSEAQIARAAAILRTGGLVAFPTETVYGLGADALDEKAVARVFDVKARPRFDPLIVHVADHDWIPRLAAAWTPQAQRLADRFWPGPLTLVLPKTPLVPDLVTAGCETVALRIPDHPVALALLRAADVPIAAPSANPFGRISPTTAAHVREQLGDQIDLILDGGACRVGVESTVLQLTPAGPAVLRPGGTTIEDIEDMIGPISISSATHADPPSAGFVSPGTLATHYAPRTPLTLRDEYHLPPLVRGGQGGSGTAKSPPSSEPSPSQLGLLAFRPPSDPERFARVEILSRSGDLREAAANFFAALRRLDAAGLDLIVAEVFPDVGLGRALNDRLRRAVHV
jgi:L-threonylcarbamoyladenylate synthase